MEKVTFYIVKKNRKYFAAKAYDRTYFSDDLLGKNCKIIIDRLSENLQLGKNRLLVNDLSRYTKYSSYLIFQLADIRDHKKYKLKTILKMVDYNKNLVQKCENLGGLYNKEDKIWVFKNSVSKKEIEELDFIYNSKKVIVKITLSYSNFCRSGIWILGFPIANGSTMSKNITLLSGRGFQMWDSGRIFGDWSTIVHDGTEIKMEIPSELLKSLGRITYQDDLEIYRDLFGMKIKMGVVQLI